MAEQWIETPYLEELTTHIEKWVGPVEEVLHELVSDVVHVDVLLVKPTESRNFYTLVTAGMSAKPMEVPKEMAVFARSELIVTLPPDNLFLSGIVASVESGDEGVEDEDPPGFFPIRYLKQYARYPHLVDTWLGPGHTLVTSDPPSPLAPETAMTAFLVHFPFAIPSHEGWKFTAKDGNDISLLQLYPIHTDELEFKLNNDGDALADKLADAGALEYIQANRSSVVKKKKFFGLF